ncbi:MAG TPA: aspartate aminotransferase family protein [Ilumatobacter sp.]|nr:aspartate aminotransferase family protein [Ilumatobacter sp.]
MTLHELAQRHLWGHFSVLGAEPEGIKVIERGEGCYVYDSDGKRYLDGLAGLFCNAIGHGRPELAEAAADQAATLGFFPIWTYAHPTAIELAAKLASLAPGDLNRVFFTSGGSEAVESAWKLARAYWKAVGKPQKVKVLSRYMAYHGTSMGALSITGVPAIRNPFEPLVPGAYKVPNTNRYRHPLADDPEAFLAYVTDAIEQTILAEGPDTVAAIFLEPMQNTGGCLAPPPGYFQRVREICDQYDVLLVSDEVICAFGRLGYMFGCERYGYQPDIITCAKALTSAYQPLGAAIVSDRLAEPFLPPPVGSGQPFLHGFTFAGHPVACAVALRNLAIFEDEQILAHVRTHEAGFKTALKSLTDLPIVGDFRGEGYFYALELVKDRDTGARFDEGERNRLLRGFLSPRLLELGLICRADDRAEPIVQLSPPLIAGPDQFDEIVTALRTALTEAMAII